MKALAILLFSLCAATGVVAQREQHVYADIALPIQGASVVYTRKVKTHFDLGGGIQVFNNSAKYLGINSAVFIDLRNSWERKKHQWFLPIDVGISRFFGEKPDPAYAVFSPFGLYTAIGGGYCRTVTRSGMGPYVSLAFRGGSSFQRYFTPRTSDMFVFDLKLLLSVGFKF